MLIGGRAWGSDYTFLENGGSSGKGSDSAFPLDTPSRIKIDLSGTWQYSVDGGPSGTVKVPSAYDFVGKVMFERSFEITAEQIERYEFQLVMVGTNYSCEVSLNGDFLTSHLGGYTSFSQPIPGNVLQPGKENVVRVLVDNRLDARKTLPLRSQVWGWRNYGGILRDVFILGTPKLFIRELVLRSELEGNFATARVTANAALEGSIEIHEPESPGKKNSGPGFFVEIFDKVSGFPVGKSALVSLVHQGDGWENARADVVIPNPKLWSPESPELYLVKTYIVRMEDKEMHVLDEYDLNFGVRQFRIDNGNFRLNGSRVTLKGVIWNEDHPTWGSSLTYEEMEKDIVLIKNLGANLVRFANHPPHPYMLNLCDRYGLFAMEELSVSNVPGPILSEEYYVDLATARMKEMIVRDRHHASVIAWGIGDELQTSSTETRQFVESLVRTVKSLDNRPTYLGTRMFENDVCTGLVDIAALNIHGLDLKAFKKELEDWKARNPGKPVIVAKFGTEVQQGNRNGYSDPLSYEAQARFYIQRFDVIKSLDYDGAIVWAFNDWLGDRPALTVNAGDSRMHSLGLVSFQREKRLAYEAVRSVFRGEKFVALPIGSYSTNAPIIYVLSGLVVLIGAAYLYNVSRRFRENLNRAVMNFYNFLTDVRDQRVVTIFHSTLLGIIVSAATAIVFSSILYHFRDNWVLDNLLSYVLVTDQLKETVIRLIRDPLRFIATFSLIFFLKLVLISGLIMALSPLFRSRVYPFHAYSITMWSTPPLLILVPIGMILYRIMESSVYVIPALVLVVVLMLWVLVRLLKGISIVFDSYTLKVYLVGLASIVGVVAIVYFYYDYTQSTSMYLTYMYDVMTTSR